MLFSRIITSSSTDLVSEFNIPTTLGALEAAQFVASAMFGVAMLQSWRFFTGNHRDKSIFVNVVAVTLTILVTISYCAQVTTIYHFTITNYGNPLALMFDPASIPLSSVASSLAIILVQTYYATRIYKLTQSPYVPAFLYLLCFADLGCSMYAARNYMARDGQTSWDLETANVPFLYASMALRCAGDTVSSVALCLLLKLKSNRGSNTTTTRVVNLVVLYTIQTGTLITCINICIAVLYGTSRSKNLIWEALYELSTPLAVASLFSLLNARSKFKQMYDSANGELLNVGTSNDTQASSVRFTTANMNHMSRMSSHNPDSAWLDKLDEMEESRGRRDAEKVNQELTV